MRPKIFKLKDPLCGFHWPQAMFCLGHANLISLFQAGHCHFVLIAVVICSTCVVLVSHAIAVSTSSDAILHF